MALAAGEVVLTPDAPVGTDSSMPLRLAAVAAERDLPITRGALHRLAELAPPPAGPLAHRDERPPWCGCWPPASRPSRRSRRSTRRD